MDSEHLNDALKAISDSLSKLDMIVEESMKVFSDFFDSLRNEEIRYIKNHSPYRPKKNH